MRFSLLLLTLLLVLAGCGEGQNQVRLSEYLPDFIVETDAGQKVSLNSFNSGLNIIYFPKFYQQMPRMLEAVQLFEGINPEISLNKYAVPGNKINQPISGWNIIHSVNLHSSLQNAFSGYYAIIIQEGTVIQAIPQSITGVDDICLNIHLPIMSGEKSITDLLYENMPHDYITSSMARSVIPQSTNPDRTLNIYCINNLLMKCDGKKMADTILNTSGLDESESAVLFGPDIPEHEARSLIKNFNIKIMVLPLSEDMAKAWRRKDRSCYMIKTNFLLHLDVSSEALSSQYINCDNYVNLYGDLSEE